MAALATSGMVGCHRTFAPNMQSNLLSGTTPLDIRKGLDVLLNNSYNSYGRSLRSPLMYNYRVYIEELLVINTTAQRVMAYLVIP